MNAKRISFAMTPWTSLTPPMRYRRGIAVLEVSVAGALSIVLMIIAAQMLGWVVSERRGAERRLWATTEAENVMERLWTVPWDELTLERAGVERLSPEAGAVLPGGKLHADVTEEVDLPAAKRIDVVVEWQRRPGESAAPVRLTAWRQYRPGVNP